MLEEQNVCVRRSMMIDTVEAWCGLQGLYASILLTKLH